MKRNYALSIVQPVLAEYRVPVYESIVNQGVSVAVFSDKAGADFGNASSELFDTYRITWRGRLFKYLPLKSLLLIIRSSNTILHFADFKYISIWVCLMFCFFGRKKVWLHGQGGYKKNGVVHDVVYFLAVLMSSGYICYTKYSEENLKKTLPKFLHSKISVVENTLSITPVNNVIQRPSTSVFYIGRIRAGCGIELLLDAASKSNVVVKVIGEGDPLYVKNLKSEYSNAIFYGSVFERDEQLLVASSCMAGVYGGDAGLSVVHYMAFGLPVIVHRCINKHMGPEPSYIVDGVNGLLFDRGSSESLSEKINILKNNISIYTYLSAGALQTFNQLSTPSMAQKFVSIMKLDKEIIG